MTGTATGIWHSKCPPYVASPSAAWIPFIVLWCCSLAAAVSTSYTCCMLLSVVQYVDLDVLTKTAGPMLVVHAETTCLRHLSHMLHELAFVLSVKSVDLSLRIKVYRWSA